MARPPIIDDKTLLAGARAIFLEKGPTATTAEIAASLGISEGAIFKRYKTKIDLFHACMTFVDEPVAWIKKLSSYFIQNDEQQQQMLSLEEHFYQSVVEGIRYFQELMPMIHMAHTSAELRERYMHTAHEPMPVSVHRHLILFFQDLHTRGYFSQYTSEQIPALAHMLLTNMYGYSSFVVMFGKSHAIHAPLEIYARTIVAQIFATPASSQHP